MPYAGSFTTGQVALAGPSTPTVVKAAALTRLRLVVKNTDSSIVMYVGGAAVTTSTGLALIAGESIAIDTTAAVYAISASGTPTIAYLEETN